MKRIEKNKIAETINYNFSPEITITDENIQIIRDVSAYLNEKIKEQDNLIIVFDCFLGINTDKLLKMIKKLKVSRVINLYNYLKSDQEIEEEFLRFLTNHPVNGKFMVGEVNDFYKKGTIEIIADQLKQSTVIFGLGASKIVKGDIHILVNTTKELAMSSLLNSNEYLTEKRLKYLDFQVFDIHKRYQLHHMDFVIDYSSDFPSMIKTEDYKAVVNTILSQPFRTTPSFEDNIWGGGQWFKARLGADIGDRKPSFLISSILEEQSVLTKINGNYFVIPGADIISLNPCGLLGEKIFYTYGYRTPIHIILVDTFGGQNSSLQVHPTAAYNQDFMNYPYGHHEGYYIVETNEESSVYLGVKDKYDIEEFTNALKNAQKSGEFDATEYVDRISVNKFDYFYLPGGAVHAFGKETVCMEIDGSSTTTFKLWDWGRLGEDGKPRQIDIELAKKVIQSKFTTSWSKKNLMFRESDFNQFLGDKSMRIGTMDYCPMEVYKHWFSKSLHLKNSEQLMILSLIEGNSAIIKSPTKAFEDYQMNYMETIYISKDIKELEIVSSENDRIAIIQIEKTN